MMNKIVNALYELRPNSKWHLKGDYYSDLEWLDSEQSKPTEEEINAILPSIEIAMANKEADANRRAAYVAESDPLFFKAQRGEGTMADWEAKVAEIKARYPKV